MPDAEAREGPFARFACRGRLLPRSLFPEGVKLGQPIDPQRCPSRSRSGVCQATPASESTRMPPLFIDSTSMRRATSAMSTE